MPTIDLSFAKDPNVLLLALCVGAVPALFWFFFWRKEGVAPVRGRAVAALTVAGVLAVFATLPLEQLAGHFIRDPYELTALWAGIEEILKLAALLLALVGGVSVEKPVDYALYAICVGLGFAGLENALYFLGPLRSGDVATTVLSVSTRFLGSTLMHVLASSLTGIALGFAFYRSRRIQRMTLAFGLTGAIVLHGAYNIWIVRSGEFLGTFIFLWSIAILVLITIERLRRMSDTAYSADARSAPLKALERAAKEFYLSIGSSPLDERPMRETLMAKADESGVLSRSLNELLSRLRAAYGAYLVSEGSDEAAAERGSFAAVPDAISPKAAEAVMSVLVRAAEGQG